MQINLVRTADSPIHVVTRSLEFFMLGVQAQKLNH